MKFQIVFEDDEPTQVRVYANGAIHQAPSTHPSFTAILARLANNSDDESVVTLFDPQAALNEVFRQVSPRVSVVNGTVLYDGDVLNNGVAKHILRFVEEGEMDRLTAVAAFTERVMRNPSENSREQLFAYLDKFDFTITPEGKFVAYKAVYLDENGVGISSRPAPERDQVRVDGVLVIDQPVRNIPGAVVTMPRSLVADNVHLGCSTGLHCGTWAYAKQFLNWGGISREGHILEVHVDPVDVVSVPHDENTQKIRVCRYEVIQVLDDNYKTAITPKPVVAEPDDEFLPFGEDDNISNTGVPFDDGGFKAGDKVVNTMHLYNERWDEIPSGTTGTVVRGDKAGYLRVKFENETENEWLTSRFAPVPVEDVTKAEVVDTRLNYTKQKRYPPGTKQNGKSIAGRFIPRDHPHYDQFPD